MKIKRSIGEKIFDIVNVIFMLCMIVITLYPLWFVLISSLSDPTAVSEGRTMLLPVFPEGQLFNFAAYKEAFEFSDGIIGSAYLNTLYYSFGGTAICMILTVLGAYPLSKKRLKGRMFFTMIMLVSMWFNAGLIPMYLNFSRLGLVGTRASLLIGFALSAFNVVLIRTYFTSISDSLEESAKMDGANDWTILFRIYIPLAVPALMTVTLYYFVEKWNSYIWAQILLSQAKEKQPLQVILKAIIVDRDTAEATGQDTSKLTSETVIYATIMLSALPMIIIYPFIQKFFVKGIMVGSVKG